MSDEELVRECWNTIARMITYAQDGHLLAILFLFGSSMKIMCEGTGVPYSFVVKLALEE